MANKSPTVTFTNVTQNYYFDLESLPHRYYLELVMGEREKILDVVEMPLVQRVRGNSPHALKSTQTINGTWDESEGFRVRFFEVMGRTGYTSVHFERYHRFRNFVERVVQLKHEHESAFTRGDNYQLILNFPFEGESYYCNVLGLVYERDRARQSLSKDWSLSFKTRGFATRKWTMPQRRKDYLDSTCGPDDDQCHIGPRHPCRFAAKRAIDVAPAEMAERFEEKFNVIFEKCDQVYDQGISGGQSQSDETLNSVANLYGMSATTYEDLSAYSAGLDDDLLPLIVDTLGWLSNVMMECKLIFGTNARELPFYLANYATNGVYGEVRASAEEVWRAVAGFSAMAYSTFWGSGNDKAADAPNFISPPRPVVEVKVEAGDSTVYDTIVRVFGIADRDIGDVVIASMGMQSEREWGNGAFLKAGDTLLVPNIAGLPRVAGSTLYGSDWLVRNGDFVLNEAGDDVVLVEHEACWEQNMRHRFQTEKQEIRMQPDVGVYPLEALLDPNLNVGRLVSDVKGQALADYRTERITFMQYKDEGSAGVVAVGIQGVTNSTKVILVGRPVA